MAHDVFVSYSSKDKPVADAACAALEARRLRCWIAPRDVLPGSEYGASLLDAIEGSSVMVLVLSTHSNASPQVMREVERAVSKAIPILPFRIDDVSLSRSMEYFVSSQHWLDAITPPMERHLERLCDSVGALLTKGQPPVAATAEPELDPGSENLNPEMTAHFQLRVVAGAEAGAIWKLSRTRMTVGRYVGCDLVLKDRALSRTHFALNWDASRRAFVLVDFGAANPVTVNGQMVRGTRELAAGDELTVGGTRIVLEPIPSAAPVVRQLTLSFETGGASTTRTFDGDRVVVGRGAACDLSLDDVRTSSRHCMFVREPSGEWTVLDAGSANGTWVNGEKLVRAVAKPGDVVLIGGTQVRIDGVE